MVVGIALKLSFPLLDDGGGLKPLGGRHVGNGDQFPPCWMTGAD